MVIVSRNGDRFEMVIVTKWTSQLWATPYFGLLSCQLVGNPSLLFQTVGLPFSSRSFNCAVRPLPTLGLPTVGLPTVGLLPQLSADFYLRAASQLSGCLPDCRAASLGL
jgi:hypothetical protein